MLCGMLIGTGMAQEKADPTPKQALVPGGFRMFLVADGRYDVKDDKNRVGRLHDAVTEYGLSTTIGVFVRGIPKEMDDPAVSVLKKQQELATKYRAKRLACFAVFLALTKDFADDDNRDARITEIGNLAKGADVPLVSVGLAEATIVGEGDALTVPKQVAAWGIGADDSITIILYHRLKIIKRWKFAADKPPTDAEFQDLAAEVDKILGKMRDSDEKK